METENNLVYNHSHFKENTNVLYSPHICELGIWYIFDMHVLKVCYIYGNYEIMNCFRPSDWHSHCGESHNSLERWRSHEVWLHRERGCGTHCHCGLSNKTQRAIRQPGEESTLLRLPHIICLWSRDLWKSRSDVMPNNMGLQTYWYHLKLILILS